MLATVTPILHSRPTKDGKFQLAIRITKDRKSSYVFFGQAIDKKYWDKKTRKVKKGHPNSAYLNALLIKKRAEVNKINITDELEERESSAQSVHGSIRSKNNRDSFFALAEKYLDNLIKEGKYNRWNADKPRVNRFKEFLNQQDTSFKKITASLLNDFKAYIKGKYNVSERTAINYLIVIRTIYNQAIKGNIVDQKYYPFGKNKVKIRFPQSVKLGLSKEEITKIEEIDLSKHPKIDNARNIWLISFYFAGMRISDTLQLKWSDIQDGRLYYKMGKNDKADS